MHTPKIRFWRSAVATVLAMALAPTAWASLDSSARTTDHSINTPTSWWISSGRTAAQVGALLSSNGARLTQLEVEGVVSGSPRFSVRMVRNSGAYAVPGWWWYHGLTFAQVGSLLSSNNARLVDLDPYDAGGGVIRYAAVMVSNTGTSARAWSYLGDVSSSQIATHLSSSGHRLVDLDTFYVGTSKRYSMVAVANTGTDAKSWQWWLNQSSASVSSKVNAFAGRIVKLDRNRDGTYNFIQVKNTSTNNSAWWYQYGFTSMTAMANFANQMAARAIDVQPYVSGGVRRYNAVFIDNANASTRRMRGVYGPTFLDANGGPTRGIFEAHLQQVGGSTKVNLNSSRRAESASSLKSLHLLTAMRRVAAGTDTLSSTFRFYNYSGGKGKDSCPKPAEETAANQVLSYNFEKGLDEMMRISDNRTTRGVVIRYGGFAPFNATAAATGLVGTTLRHNIGCGYWDLVAQKPNPNGLRNDTTAADLARIYAGVWNSSLLSNSHGARTEFLESTYQGTSGGYQAIINEEAAKQGKSAIAAQFGSLVRQYGKGGAYNTCLYLNSSGSDCARYVLIRSDTGLVRLPAKTSSGLVSYRTYAHGSLVSDVPYGCSGCLSQSSAEAGQSKAVLELFRDEIRLALLTW